MGERQGISDALFCESFFVQSGKVADRSGLRRLVYTLMDQVPEEKTLRRYDRLIRRSEKISSPWVRILMFPTPNRQWGYLRKWYEYDADVLFEGHSFPGIRDYDEYLTFKYKDYMKEPPEKQRKTHPVSEIVLPEQISENIREKTGACK